MTIKQPTIGIILASTREQRAGERIARWFFRLAQQREDLVATLIDLKEWPLPFYAYSKKPSEFETNYPDGLAHRWAKLISELDGFIVVTPEYNHGYPGALKNAIDYVYAGWNRKPVAFVSYGGAAAGTRAVEQLRQVFVDLQAILIRTEVNFQYPKRSFPEGGEPANDAYARSAQYLLDQMAWWVDVLHEVSARHPFPEPRKG